MHRLDLVAQFHRRIGTQIHRLGAAQPESVETLASSPPSTALICCTLATLRIGAFRTERQLISGHVLRARSVGGSGWHAESDGRPPRSSAPPQRHDGDRPGQTRARDRSPRPGPPIEEPDRDHRRKDHQRTILEQAQQRTIARGTQGPLPVVTWLIRRPGLSREPLDGLKEGAQGEIDDHFAAGTKRRSSRNVGRKESPVAFIW